LRSSCAVSSAWSTCSVRPNSECLVLVEIEVHAMRV
jgi:hypothetical protein